MESDTDTDVGLAEFEDGAQSNGKTWWSARWLRERLGYATWSSFKGVVNRAQQSCLRVGLDLAENFVPVRVLKGKRHEEDWRLSRFACFLIASHADSSKPEVEQVKAYLASLAAALLETHNDVLERLQEREVLSIGEREMSAAAVASGVRDRELGIFKDDGYRGMYNMSLARLKATKGLKGTKRTLYDFMGITELAANSFRVTQTAQRLKNSQARGLHQAGQIAEQVGREVRDTMLRDGGTAPEDLPIETDIKKAKSGLKRASRQMKKLDS